MTTEDNGNISLVKATSSSNEDVSEYTDADESISAPTEFLAEFLSALMLKDYVTALKYCKLILQYEPNNSTAKEFHPLIIEKLRLSNTADGSSGEDDDASTSGTSSDTDTSSSSSSDSEDQEEEDDDEEIEVEKGDKGSKGSSDGDATTGSYSSLEDDEAEIDQLAALAAKYQIDNVNLGNGNKIYDTNIGNVFENKLSNESITATVTANTNLIVSGHLPFGTSSDSESPTEPVSQQTVQMAAMMRARIVPTKQ